MRLTASAYRSVSFVLSFFLVSNSLFAQEIGPQLPAPQPTPKPTAPVAAPTPAQVPPVATTPTRPPGIPANAIILPPDPIRPKPKKKTLLPPNGSTNTAVVATPTPPTATKPLLPANPFDVTAAKTPTVAPQPDTAKKRPEPIPYKGDINNPFDLPPTSVGAAVEKPASTENKATTSVAHKETHIEKTPWENPLKKIFNKGDKDSSQLLLFAVLFSALIYLSFVMTVYQQQVSKIWGAFTNEQALASLYRERGGQMSFHYWAIYALFVISTGVFCYQVARHFGAPMNGALVGLTICMFGVALVTFFRHTFLKIIAAIFPFFKEVNLYIFTITIFDLTMGLLLVPFVIFIAFAPESLRSVALYAALSLVAFVYALRSVRGLMIATKHILEYRFHFLLYLCAVEIAPLLILLKLGM